MSSELIFRQLGLQPYQDTWARMQAFTVERTTETADEVWLLEHPPVFTQGQAGRAEHILNPHHIDVVQSDRGGQVTYHGPGQLVAYILVDLRRRRLTVRALVCAIERSIIDTLADFGIHAEARRDAPGVYINGAKVASLGLRVKRGCSYHGLAFNIDMDLTPFQWINPCGMAQLAMTQVSDHVTNTNLAEISDRWCQHFQQTLAAATTAACQQENRQHDHQ